MNKTKKNVVVVLAKKPEVGRVKTRIAKDTSDAFAYKFSIACLEDLLNNLNNSNYFDFIVGTDTRNDLEWYEKTYKIDGLIIDVPPEGNFCERMKYVFRHLSKVYEYEKIILIPMDMPFIQVEEIISAFTRMEKTPYILGPETNGGIYLIGMNGRCYKNKLFDNVPWSTPHSFDKLVDNFGLMNTFKLRFKDDINTFQDILANRDQIKLHCPKVFDLMLREGYSIEEMGRYVDFDSINICLAAISAVIERENNGKTEILLQVRNKPTSDPVYSGCYEIPSGLIERYEDVFTAVVREVKEETGLDVVVDSGSYGRLVIEGGNNDSVSGFTPFYVTQQLKGGRAYLGLSFVCRLKESGASPKENKYETKNPMWVTIEKLEKILRDKPTCFFLLNVPILQKYLEYKKNDRIGKN